MLAMIDRTSAPHDLRERILWLRSEAAALLSEAGDLEKQLKYPHEHIPCLICEDCRMAIVAEAKRLGYE